MIYRTDDDILISFQGMTLIYVITFFGGHDMWKFKIPILGWNMSEGFEVVCYGMYNKIC